MLELWWRGILLAQCLWLSKSVYLSKSICVTDFTMGPLSKTRITETKLLLSNILDPLTFVVVPLGHSTVFQY